jgi:catecholate siderophore receptor
MHLKECLMRRLPLVAAFCLLALFVHTAPAAAQAAAAGFSIEGTVLDATRAPIARARVTSLSENQQPGPSTLTDQRGAFTLALMPGRYAVTVSAEGFLAHVRNVTAEQAGTASWDVVLEIAGIHEAVTVSAPAGYEVPVITSATKTPTPLRDVPQSVTVVTKELIKDQLMMSLGDVVRYVPGITAHQGENNRDQIIVRGNSSSADFFVNGVRDDVQYYRDLYNLERVEALKGANAMMFGRGGAGGVVNQVTKEAEFYPLRTVSLQGGTYGNKRFTADLDEPLGDTAAFRVNGMFEDSDSFRQAVGLQRYGIAPTLTVVPSSRTKITLRYEHLHDTRVADRGMTSFQGRPADIDLATYYGNPNDSRVRANVNVASAAVEHRIGGVLIRHETLFGDYDRFYQNFVPGAVTADQRQVSLSAYNNETARRNLFSQTDLTYVASTGRVRHTVLAGVEIGRQLTDNFRNTGFFNNSATALPVPYASPTISTPITFRQSATDADNHLRTIVAATYAQDQIELSRFVQVIAGLRFDRFDLQYHNNRTGDTLARPDNLVSPRAGLVFKPIVAVSVYGSYSVSYLPSSGDQFSSLTTITQQVEPEKFNNYEVGAKWDLWRNLSFTTAVYRLDRTNTRSTDPNDPTRIVQTGSQRTNGYELGLNGQITPAWNVAGGYADQDAFVSSATTAAREGAQVGQVPRHTLSLWNKYQVLPKVAAGLGVLYRSAMFATIDNTVTLPGYTRADAAVYVLLTGKTRLQANVENVFNTKYYVNADSNTNISPGFPRTVRISLTTAF